MSFTNRLHNRSVFPTRHVLVCEDNIGQQARIADHLAKLFGAEREVQVSFVCGAAQAAGLLERVGVELVLLDHDMPFGNGTEFLAWLVETGRIRNIPVITFSGIPANNDAMMVLGAHHRFSKEEVISGHADGLILRLLKLPPI